MDNQIDGGQAFPRAGYDGPDRCADPGDGMSLRQWYAGLAMAAIVAKAPIISDYTSTPEEAKHKYRGYFDAVSNGAYMLADAMIAAGKETRP